MSRFRTKIGFDTDHLDENTDQTGGTNTLVDRLAALETVRATSVTTPFTQDEKLEFEEMRNNLAEHIQSMTIEDLFPATVSGSKWAAIVTAMGGASRSDAT